MLLYIVIMYFIYWVNHRGYGDSFDILRQVHRTKDNWAWNLGLFADKLIQTILGNPRLIHISKSPSISSSFCVPWSSFGTDIRTWEACNVGFTQCHKPYQFIPLTINQPWLRRSQIESKLNIIGDGLFLGSSIIEAQTFVQTPKWLSGILKHFGSRSASPLSKAPTQQLGSVAAEFARCRWSADDPVVSQTSSRCFSFDIKVWSTWKTRDLGLPILDNYMMIWTMASHSPLKGGSGEPLEPLSA